jgi:hypothetical protein
LPTGAEDRFSTIRIFQDTVEDSKQVPVLADYIQWDLAKRSAFIERCQSISDNPEYLYLNVDGEFKEADWPIVS